MKMFKYSSIYSSIPCGRSFPEFPGNDHTFLIMIGSARNG